MNCCQNQNNSPNQKIEVKSSRFLNAHSAEALRHNKIVEEKKKVSWKIIITAIIILGLLIVGSLSLVIH